MSATPVESAANAKLLMAEADPLDGVLEALWKGSRAAEYGLSCAELGGMLREIGAAQNWGAGHGEVADQQQRRGFLESLHVDELALARACAAGCEHAWEVFLTRYRETLYGAAYAITRQDALGRELADSLYGDLYGTAEHDGARRSRLESYSGRGSLAGWLRSVLAQRFVDHHRKTARQVSLEENEAAEQLAAAEAAPAPDLVQLKAVSGALHRVLANLEAEDRLLLASYYVDSRTLAQIGRLLGVHESTVSRRLAQLVKALRKDLLKQLERGGMSRAAAEEALTGDVRDFDIDLRRWLQGGRDSSFQIVGADASGKNA
jgi:RNA polymerase sigma-70 factor (ECF subfamily)